MRTHALAVVIAAAAVAACGGDRAPAVTVVTTSASAVSLPPPPPPAVEPTLIAIREAAHRVMSARCGECHESHRPTAKPGALAVFDLDRADWPSRFDAARFAAGLGRFSAAPPEDRQAFVAFRDAELASR